MNSLLKFCFWLVVGGACFWQCSSGEEEISLENPVRSAEEDILEFSKHDNSSFQQYAGYLPVGEPKDKKFHFYWLVEADGGSKEDYLTLWLNGGPGCSSISTLFRASGPYSLDTRNAFVKNEFSWNKLTNVLYIDGPVGTGLSYSAKGHIDSNDDSSLRDNFDALMAFYKKFPHYKKKRLSLRGESYAAVYLSMLAEKLIKDEPSINLSSIVIGNGYTDAKRLGESFIFYSYYHGLIDAAGWRDITTYCCDGNTPDHKKCHFAGTSVKCLDLIGKLSSFILEPKSGLNPQNIYDADYVAPNYKALLHDGNNSGSSMSTITNSSEAKTLCSLKSNEQFVSTSLLLDSVRALTSNSTIDSHPNSSPCASREPADDHERFLSAEEIRKVLHIPERFKKPFQQCSREIFLSYKQIYPYQKGGIEQFLKRVMEAKNDVQIVFYNGDIDLVSNFIGNDWFTEELGRPVLKPYSPMMIEDKIVGFVKAYSNVIYMVIKGAGHSPTNEKPKLMFDILNAFPSI